MLLKKYVRWMQQHIEDYRELDDNHLKKEVAENLRLHFNMGDVQVTEQVCHLLNKKTGDQRN